MGTLRPSVATLTPESQPILNGVAESLVANDTIKVQVSGHTDAEPAGGADPGQLSAAR